MGDSITAGVGARANSVLDIFTEYRCPLNFHPFFFKIHTTNAIVLVSLYIISFYRGVSFSIGGLVSACPCVLKEKKYSQSVG